MKKALLAVLAVLLLNGSDFQATQKHGGSLTFDVGDKREVITRSIDKHLLLRVEHPDNGWDIKVVRKPFAVNSSNLLYHSREWHGPYPSQVDAWHVARKYFPNERELDVRGYPYAVKIILVNPVVAGDESSFVSGKIKIIWNRKLKNRNNPFNLTRLKALFPSQRTMSLAWDVDMDLPVFDRRKK